MARLHSSHHQLLLSSLLLSLMWQQTWCIKSEVDGASLSVSDYAFARDETFEDLRLLIRGPNVHELHGYRFYDTSTWSPLHNPRYNTSYDSVQHMSKELEAFLRDYMTSISNWTACDPRPLVVGECARGGLGNWIRGDIGAVMLALELGAPYARSCSVDKLIPLEQVWTPRPFMDWTQYRGAASHNSAQSCSQGCRARHFIKSPNAASGYSPSEANEAMFTTLTKARTAQPCSTIEWKQYSGFSTEGRSLPPLPKSQRQRIDRVPEFRSLLGCHHDGRECNGSLTRMGAIATFFFMNVVVRPSRDLATIIRQRLQELSFIPTEQYIIALHLRLGLPEKQVNWWKEGDLRNVTHAYVERGKLMCQRLECAYGKRPKGCAFLVATDSAEALPFVSEWMEKDNLVHFRGCTGRFLHLSAVSREHAALWAALTELKTSQRKYEAVLCTFMEEFLLSAADGIVHGASTFSKLAALAGGIPLVFDDGALSRKSLDFTDSPEKVEILEKCPLGSMQLS